jgi:hypothetical protein
VLRASQHQLPSDSTPTARASLHPDARSAKYYAAFCDLDGNEWLLQEIKTRLPGRVWED